MSDQNTLDEPATSFNVLFVCTGNTCRSPMAEAVARAELAKRGWRHVQVASAGSAAEVGSPAAPEARAVTARHGVQLDPHRARLLTPELVDWADLILGMSGSHLGAIARLGGEPKMALLGDFAADDGSTGIAVRDPYGYDESVYEETFDELRRMVAGMMDRLEPILHP